MGKPVIRLSKNKVSKPRQAAAFQVADCRLTRVRRIPRSSRSTAAKNVASRRRYLACIAEKRQIEHQGAEAKKQKKCHFFCRQVGRTQKKPAYPGRIGSEDA